MPEALMLVAAWLATLAGMGWFALAMEAHWQQVRGSGSPPPATARLLRVLGAAALAASLALCLAADHASMAALVWVMMLAAAALAVAFALSWRPRLLAPLAGRLGAAPGR